MKTVLICHDGAQLDEAVLVRWLASFSSLVGICPEYRNAHGCFWALANRDLDKVGMTLLRIDKGVDTGPVFGYYSYPFDELGRGYIVHRNQAL